MFLSDRRSSCCELNARKQRVRRTWKKALSALAAAQLPASSVLADGQTPLLRYFHECAADSAYSYTGRQMLSAGLLSQRRTGDEADGTSCIPWAGRNGHAHGPQVDRGQPYRHGLEQNSRTVEVACRSQRASRQQSERS